MIPSGVEIYIALEPIDMRLSFDRLSGLAQENIFVGKAKPWVHNGPVRD